MNLFPNAPFVLPYQGVAPSLQGPILRAAAGSAVLGRVTLGAGAVLGPFAVLRADGHAIEAGSELHLGAHSTVHIAHAVYGTTIGDRVTVGTNAVVHACTVGNDCVIEDDVAILDGSVIGHGTVIARGSVVFPRSELPPGQWCEGVPAVPVRPVGAAELDALHERIRTRALAVPPAVPSTYYLAGAASGAQGYVAATAGGMGEVHMGEGSSLWFGCVVDATGRAIAIASGANVQDNSILRSGDRAVTVGKDTTIGHNVLLHDCSVGDRVLVGMGSTLAPGTVVQDDVLIAAGSTTTRGQVLESGWLWGGRPARQLARLDQRKRDLIRQSAAIYREYAMEFSIPQETARRDAVESSKAIGQTGRLAANLEQ